MKTGCCNSVISVKVIPNASRNEIVSWENDTLKIRIHAQPRGGKANKALIEFLSKASGISKKNITIQRGENSRQKWIAFDGIDRTGLLKRLGIQSDPPHGQ